MAKLFAKKPVDRLMEEARDVGERLEVLELAFHRRHCKDRRLVVHLLDQRVQVGADGSLLLIVGLLSWRRGSDRAALVALR